MTPTFATALGPLATIVDDAVRDVCVLSDGRVWCRRDNGFEMASLVVDPREARRIGVGLIELGGGRVDDARPLGDSALAGEVRVHVALPPAARSGAVVSLRFPRSIPVDVTAYDVPSSWSWDDLATRSILVTGATGSGKTTLLEHLITRVPDDERVVVIEDIPEIVGRHPHLVHLETRAASPEGTGQLSMATLVRETLRMSPDRIVVGEVRGAEIVDMLMALTAGHRGMSSLHARTLSEVPERLTTLGLVAGLDAATLARLIPIAFDTVVHCDRHNGRVSIRAGRFATVHGQLLVEQ